MEILRCPSITAQCSAHIPCISFSSTNWSLETHYTGSKASQVQEVRFHLHSEYRWHASETWITILFAWATSLSLKPLFKILLASCPSHKLLKIQILIETLFHVLSYCILLKAIYLCPPPCRNLASLGHTMLWSFLIKYPTYFSVPSLTLQQDWA